MTKAVNLDIEVADYNNGADQQAISSLMQMYSADPMGGGSPMAAEKADAIALQLQEFGRALTILARVEGEAAGLINCIEGFSTFQGRRLLNIHDVVVHPHHRSKGLASSMFAKVEAVAEAKGYCKLTLEVLDGNKKAKALYTRLGFAPYQLEAKYGVAHFYEKKMPFPLEK